MVDQGMFHLVDLRKALARDKSYLVLVGGEEDLGRDLKLRGARLVEDSNRRLGIDFESRALENTGHELTPSCKEAIGDWVFEVVKSDS